MNVRQVKEGDLKKIRAFVKNNPPLGLHTLYTYWVLFSQFRQLWYVCEEDSEIVGFISGVKSLSLNSTALIWQIGVSKNMRGKGVSIALIDAFVNSCKQLSIEHGLVTIDPNNKASLKLFESYFSKHSNFKAYGNLSLDDELTTESEHEDIYSFEI